MAYYKKLRRRKSAQGRSDDTPGHDAFLDIVANLVGILIILVVLVGAHAGAAMGSSSEDSQPLDLPQLERELAENKRTAMGLLNDNRTNEVSIANEDQMLLGLQIERQRMLIELAELEKATAKNSAKLEQEQQSQLAMRRRLIDLKLELNRAQAEFAAVDAEQKSLSETIVHYPTPVAKTVFSDEVHFRILHGRIVYVPVDQLVAQMRAEWKLKSEKLKTAERTVETVGPIASFRLQYTLEAEELQTQTQLGIVIERKIAFRRFVILAASDRMGEPAEQAMLENSEFLTRIAQLQPGKTTISIWTYPDSYSEFNNIKAYLQQAGFRTAVWPLPKGRLISGGPDGYRSSAQ